MKAFWNLIATALKIPFLLNPYLVLVKKYNSKQKLKALEKSLCFSPAPSFINEADLQRDFDEFTRKMRCKWYIRNESQDIPSDLCTYKSKSTWIPEKGSPALKLFPSKGREDNFLVLPGHPKKLNLDREEYLTMRIFKMTEVSYLNQQIKGE